MNLPRTQRTLIAAFALVLALAGALVFARPTLPAASAQVAEAGLSADSSATTDLPLPLQMADVRGARQLIVATGNKLGDTTGTLQFFDYDGSTWVCKLTVACRFGKRGLTDGTLRRAGNKTTPTGIWSMPSYVFGYRAKPPVGTKMRYVRITKRSWWSSKRGASYNRWVEARRWPGEYLYHVIPQYEYAVSTGYNARPNQSVYGRGTGIFLHIQGKGLTAGCVAIPRGSMWRVTALLDPAKRPAFAIGTLATGTPTSIRAY